MRRKLIRMTLRLLLAGCMTIAPAFLAQTAHAQSNVDEIITYYSDSTHQTVVGTKTIFCDGQVSIRGTVTRFAVPRFFPCLIGRP